MTSQVDIKHLMPVIRSVLHQAFDHTGARIVHQYVDAAKFFDHAVCHFNRGVWISHIQSDGHGLAADIAGDLFRVVFVDIRHHDMRTLSGKRSANCRPNTTSPTGHDHDSTLKLHQPVNPL